MQFVVTIPFLGTGARAYVAPGDCLLIGVMGTAGDVSVSTDPAITPGMLQLSPADDSITGDLLGVFIYGAFTSTLPPTRIPISAGQTLYVAVSSAGFALLLFETSALSRDNT